jgi:hypothetical protein
MLRKFLRNRRGTAEIIGSALFIIIILFFFSNVYLWHDQATNEMNNLLLERMNSSVSMVATGEGVNITNNGGVTFALSRLWIIDSQEQQHYYADLENIPGHPIIWVDAGQTIPISLNSTVQTATGSPISVTWDDALNCPMVQYAPPEYGVNLVILTDFGDTASCVVRASAPPPNIAANLAGGIVGTLVTLSGWNFENTSLITVKYDGITVPTSPPQAQTNSSGGFSNVWFNIPPSAFGNHNVTVTDNDGNSAEPVTLDVTPSITVAPTSGLNGTFATVVGNGFAADSSVTIDTGMMGESNMPVTATATTTVTGSFTASFIVPQDNYPRSYTITATDANSDSASGTFTIVG